MLKIKLGKNTKVKKSKGDKMSEEVIRYGAGGVPYVKKTEAPKEEVKEEVISEILTKNPNKEKKSETTKEKK